MKFRLVMLVAFVGVLSLAGCQSMSHDSMSDDEMMKSSDSSMDNDMDHQMDDSMNDGSMDKSSDSM